MTPPTPSSPSTGSAQRACRGRRQCLAIPTRAVVLLLLLLPVGDAVGACPTPVLGDVITTEDCCPYVQHTLGQLLCARFDCSAAPAALQALPPASQAAGPEKAELSVREAPLALHGAEEARLARDFACTPGCLDQEKLRSRLDTVLLNNKPLLEAFQDQPRSHQNGLERILDPGDLFELAVNVACGPARNAGALCLSKCPQLSSVGVELASDGSSVRGSALFELRPAVPGVCEALLCIQETPECAAESASLTYSQSQCTPAEQVSGDISTGAVSALVMSSLAIFAAVFARRGCMTRPRFVARSLGHSDTLNATDVVHRSSPQLGGAGSSPRKLSSTGSP